MVSLVCFTAALGTKKKVEHRQGHVEKTECGLGLNLSVQVGIKINVLILKCLTKQCDSVFCH